MKLEWKNFLKKSKLWAVPQKMASPLFWLLFQKMMLVWEHVIKIKVENKFTSLYTSDSDLGDTRLIIWTILGNCQIEEYILSIKCRVSPVVSLYCRINTRPTYSSPLFCYTSVFSLIHAPVCPPSKFVVLCFCFFINFFFLFVLWGLGLHLLGHRSMTSDPTDSAAS